MTRCTLDRLHPSCSAIFRNETPCSRNARTLVRSTLFFLPPLPWEYLPAALAFSIPSRWRSLRIFLSNSAKMPKTSKSNLVNGSWLSLVKVRFSFTNFTVTPFAISWLMMFCRSWRLRASLSMEWAHKVSPSSSARGSPGALVCRYSSRMPSLQKSSRNRPCNRPADELYSGSVCSP